MKPEALTFLQKDYELKIRYLSDHYSRMWSRCNFFVALESGLSIALFSWFKDKGSFSKDAAFITVIGAVSSLCWYIFGAQDRYLAEVYRKQVRIVGETIARSLNLPDELEANAPYTYVGDTETEKAQVEPKIYQWRWGFISTTKLAVWFPLIVLIYWVIMLAFTLR